MAARITIADLAERLQISRAAVSYALNGQPGVSAETRARVLDLAHELGWYPSSSARALSRSRTGAIGVVLSREPEQIGTEPYYMKVIAGIESVLIESDLALMLRMVGHEGDRDLGVYERWAGEARVDGVIVFDEQQDDPRIPLVLRLGLPAVLQGGPVEGDPLPCVVPDDPLIATLVTGHLQALGHRRLTVVSGPRRLLHERRRVVHVRQQAELRGIHATQVESDYTLESGQRCMHELMASAEPPSAILFSNDLMALGGLRGAEELGLAVPEQLSLVSWDDSLLCAVAGVTAIDRHPFEEGRRTAQVLLATIAGHEPPPDDRPESRLIPRSTTAPVAPVAHLRPAAPRLPRVVGSPSSL